MKWYHQFDAFLCSLCIQNGPEWNMAFHFMNVLRVMCVCLCVLAAVCLPDLRFFFVCCCVVCYCRLFSLHVLADNKKIESQRIDGELKRASDWWINCFLYLIMISATTLIHICWSRYRYQKSNVWIFSIFCSVFWNKNTIFICITSLIVRVPHLRLISNKCKSHLTALLSVSKNSIASILLVCLDS